MITILVPGEWIEGRVEAVDDVGSWKRSRCSCVPVCISCLHWLEHCMWDIKEWPEDVFKGLPKDLKRHFLEQWMIKKVKREG